MKMLIDNSRLSTTISRSSREKKPSHVETPSQTHYSHKERTASLFKPFLDHLGFTWVDPREATLSLPKYDVVGIG